MDSWQIVVAGIGGAIVTGLVSLLPLRQTNRLETRRLESEDREKEFRREDIRRQTADQLIQGCCESAGIYIGISDRATRGDKSGRYMEDEARGRMYAAWARFLPYSSPLQKGIIQTMLSTMTNDSEDRGTPIAVKQCLKDLLDASDDGITE